MEISSPRWLSELVMDDIIPMPPFQSRYGMMASFEDCKFESIDIHHPLIIPPEAYSSLNNNNNNNNNHGNEVRKLKTSPPNSSDSQIISFKNDTDCCSDGSMKPKHDRVITTRSRLHAQDHVLAERKRREKLTQRFIALSAIIPGLKKMDKATVLGDAIDHIKDLQQRVKTLEADVSRKTVESVVVVKKSQVVYSVDDDDASSSDHESSSCSHLKLDHHLPEIEARVSEKQLLIRVHSQRRHGCITKVIELVEKVMNLTILNTAVLPFGSSILDITIVAQMEDKLSMTIEELVKNIRQDLLNFM